MDGVTVPDVEELRKAFDRDGYVTVSGLLDPDGLAALERSVLKLQGQLMRGELDPARHAGDVYTAVASGERAAHPHYVLDVGRLSPEVHDIFHHEVLMDVLQRCLGGVAPWEFDASRGRDFGVVFQDARPGTTGGTAASAGTPTDRPTRRRRSFPPSPSPCTSTGRPRPTAF